MTVLRRFLEVVSLAGLSYPCLTPSAGRTNAVSVCFGLGVFLCLFGVRSALQEEVCLLPPRDRENGQL